VKFTEIGKIRAHCSSILNLTKNGEKIGEKDHIFLKELLEKHKNKDAKLKDLSYFTTGQPKEFASSRCFFIVKSDGTQEDFSVHKCLQTLTEKNN